VVQEALSLGALGYVSKTRVGSDLLPAVDPVLVGREFVSDGLAGRCHKVQAATASINTHSGVVNHGKAQFKRIETVGIPQCPDCQYS
jgi:DNA-binding NarL/FixJ family response regulator